MTLVIDWMLCWKRPAVRYLIKCAVSSGCLDVSLTSEPCPFHLAALMSLSSVCQMVILRFFGSLRIQIQARGQMSFGVFLSF